MASKAMLLNVLPETKTLSQNVIQHTTSFMQCSYGGEEKTTGQNSVLSSIAGWLSGANSLLPVDWQQLTDHRLNGADLHSSLLFYYFLTAIESKDEKFNLNLEGRKKTFLHRNAYFNAWCLNHSFIKESP